MQLLSDDIASVVLDFPGTQPKQVPLRDVTHIDYKAYITGTNPFILCGNIPVNKETHALAST
jgi:hypothetical protein